MPNKKKEKKVVGNETTSTTLTAPAEVTWSLNAQTGRQDLDELFKKVEDKLNEIIRKN